jgi:hypothetical protein
MTDAKSYEEVMKDPMYIDLIVATDLFASLSKLKKLDPDATTRFSIEYNKECPVCRKETALIRSSLAGLYCLACDKTNHIPKLVSQEK